MCDCVFPDEAIQVKKSYKIKPSYRDRYNAMIDRCYNPARKDFIHYGARGIKVCKEWLENFELYVNDVGPRPPGTTLDREENDKGYCKHNVKWSTLSQQNFNRRPLSKKSTLPKGIYKLKYNYFAQIRIDGTIYYLGSSSDINVVIERFRELHFEWFGHYPY